MNHHTHGNRDNSTVNAAIILCAGLVLAAAMLAGGLFVFGQGMKEFAEAMREQPGFHQQTPARDTPQSVESAPEIQWAVERVPYIAPQEHGYADI